MCGFAGIVHGSSKQEVDQSAVKQMIDVIAHRGPDDSGIEVINTVGFGFRRLSIVDLSLGHQPLFDANRKACIVFNGEIYNFQELKSELQNKGVTFQTSSDTEVLLNCYLVHGSAFVSKLRGMFAFAIYDFEQQKILLGRDPFGIKPLYYKLTNNTLHFASELKSILAVCKDVSFDYNSLDSYFSYGFTTGSSSFYNEIRRVESGTVMEITWPQGTLVRKENTYFNPTYPENATLHFEEAKERTRLLVADSVKRHLISDVPVGAFLSGGIDSNIVVSQMRKLYAGDLMTFTVGFNESHYDESRIAKEAALFYGTKHHELIIERSASQMLDQLMDMYDEPFADSSAIPTFMVSRLAAQHVKVVLSGDGGDELFGGYSSYQRMLKIAQYRNLIHAFRWMFKLGSRAWPQGVTGKRFLYSLSKRVELQYAHHMLFNDDEKRWLFNQETRQKIEIPGAVYKESILKQSTSASFASKLFELDLRVFMKDDVLVKVDRASMANSLEVRVPFIDVDLFHFAASLPWQMKVSGDSTKHILREAFKSSIPENVYHKPKTGFTIPISKWFQDDFDDFAKSHLEHLKSTHLFNQRYIDQLLNTKQLGAMSSRIWPLMIFSVWHRKNQHVRFD
ncbi:MAG: asparagine synthase (glutamine-hydrolyzing) [Flavobacteriales bacterium]